MRDYIEIYNIFCHQKRPKSENMRVRTSDPLTFKVVVEVQDLTQFRYKFAGLLLIYILNFLLLLEVEI